jgi:cold shock CspA family protein
MGKSQETFSKKEREKKKIKQRQDKMEKMQERKANAQKGKSLDDMIAYIDEDGNLSDTPPDPRKRRVVKQEDIQLSVQVQHAEKAEAAIRKGVVAFFNDDKGFGFINDLATQERIFVHVNQLSTRLKENDKVTFEVERGVKGLSAVNVKKDG